MKMTLVTEKTFSLDLILPGGRPHPYLEFFVGRGKIAYNPPGFVFGNTMSISSATVVYAPGIGLD
jgi:hypothetical protein